MITYKLFRIREGRLYPLFVDTKRELRMEKWLKARVGELADAKHVKSTLGPLALRPGFHSTSVPFADWIGRKIDSGLVQRRDTVWCECEVKGIEQIVEDRRGLRVLPKDWYWYCTRPNQPFPWIISNRIRINRMLDHAEVEKICQEHGVKAQKMEV